MHYKSKKSKFDKVIVADLINESFSSLTPNFNNHLPKGRIVQVCGSL